MKAFQVKDTRYQPAVGTRPINFDLATADGMENAVAWQRKLFATISDGGKWVVPRSGTIYTVHHAKKTAVRQLGFAPEPDIERVIKAAGWTVISMIRAPRSAAPK